MAEMSLRVDSARFNPINPAEREAIEAEIERLIGMLDLIDGDPDLELCGDETDGVGAEDEECAWLALFGRGAGCEVSDEGGEPQIYKVRPQYGLDQDAGPINHHEAKVAYHRELYGIGDWDRNKSAAAYRN